MKEDKNKYNKNMLTIYMHENIRLRARENADIYNMSMSEYFRYLVLTDTLNRIKMEGRSNGKKDSKPSI